MAANTCEIESCDEDNGRTELVDISALSKSPPNSYVSQNQSSTCFSSLPSGSEVKNECLAKNETRKVNLINCKLDHNTQNGACDCRKCSFSINSDSDKISECEQSCDSKDSPSPSQPSKERRHYTKRRAGALYKQIKGSKVCKVSSKYFSHVHNPQKRWIPPRSPYALVQEDLFDQPWQLLVATIFLTKTTAKRALPQLHKFLARYPLPEHVLQASYEEIDEYFKTLGLVTTRSHIIKRFTVEYLEKDWTYPRELYGIGKYGDDSYRMFCINEWRQVSPDDIPLTMYQNWLLENADRLGIN